MSYQQVKKAVESEREVLKLLADLPEKEFTKLMQASAEYANAYKSVYEAKKEEEKTKQLELEVKLKSKNEEETTQRKKLTLEAEKEAREQAHRHRKEIEENRTDEEKRRVDYQIEQDLKAQSEKTRLKLNARVEFDRLDANRFEREKAKAREKAELERQAKEDEFERQKKLMEHQLRIQSELEMQQEQQLAPFRLEEELKKHERLKEFHMEQAKQVQRIKSEFDLKQVSLQWDKAMQFFSGSEGRDRLLNFAALVGASAVSIYAAKALFPLVAKGLNNYFFQPKLVGKYRSASSRSTKLPKVIFNPELGKQMDSVVTSTRNTSSRGGLFGHLLLYGKPGTGKSLFAERLAKESGLDFAMISGPSFDQFEPGEAITQIKNLFTWANSSRHGVLLFVDEADSFLEDRSTLNRERVRVLNEWINQTGTESRKFMLVYETNRPDVLDPAVESRITRSVQFPPPSLAQVKELLTQYIDLYIRNEKPKRKLGNFFVSPPRLNAEALTTEKIDRIAEVISQHEFSGRDVTNLVISLSQTAYADPNFSLSEENIQTVVDAQVTKKKYELERQQYRLERLRGLRN